MAIVIDLNGRPMSIDMPADTPLLWAVREGAGLTGTKFGCGRGLCGACTVHVDGAPVRSCSFPLSAVGPKKVTTIEGIGARGEPLQRAWIAEQVPQCGYCQSGMLMAGVALLADKPHPSDADIAGAMTNLCRCGTYVRIRRAIRRAASGQV
jgi:aerobic-type carbon monoxide dehydrogenase small subunit (CoxS/CutS family)